MTIDELCLSQGISAAELEELTHSVFASVEGRRLLTLLMHAVHPMCPTISAAGANDAHAVGVREGRREYSAFLFRLSRAPVGVLNKPVQ